MWARTITTLMNLRSSASGICTGDQTIYRRYSAYCSGTLKCHTSLSTIAQLSSRRLVHKMLVTNGIKVSCRSIGSRPDEAVVAGAVSSCVCL